MRILVGIALGFMSGFLIYMGLAMVFTDGQPSSAFVLLTFLGGWVLSSVLLIRGSRSVSKVFSRGFLLGAAEWFAMIPAGLVVSGKALSETAAQGSGSEAVVAGATIGAGLFSMITGGVSIAMAFACLIGFAISFLMGREMKPEVSAPTKTCPECAELIQAKARRCKHCGAEIAIGGE